MITKRNHNPAPFLKLLEIYSVNFNIKNSFLGRIFTSPPPPPPHPHALLLLLSDSAISIEDYGSSSIDTGLSWGTVGMGFESVIPKGPAYAGMQTSNHNNHQREQRKASVKQAWEENYALKTEELRAEERRQSLSQRNSSSITSEQIPVMQRPAPFSLRRLINIFRSKRFADRNLETLYRRYFIKVCRVSMSM